MSKSPASTWNRFLHLSGEFAIRLATCVLLLIYFKEGYSWGYRAQTGQGVFDAALPIDAWIPMVPVFIVFYMLGYLFVLVPCVLVRDRKDFYAATAVFFGMLTVAFLCFRFAPVYMHKSFAIGDDAFSRLAYFQQTKDTAYNNFPSLHVALNVYAFALIAWQWRQISWWWLPLPVLIVCSTLFVKQHLFVDVMGGLLLAWGGVFAFRRFADAGPVVTFRAWLVVVLLMTAVVLTHTERIGKTLKTIEHFLAAGGVTPAGASIALLLFILAMIGLRLGSERLAKSRDAPVRSRREEYLQGPRKGG